MNIHIVDSVKGGAGKSTFSCKLAISLIHGVNRVEKTTDNKYKRSHTDINKKKVCVVDVDLLGTSWQYIFGRALLPSSTNGSNTLVYLNDLIIDYDHFISTNYIQKIKIGIANSDAEIIDVIMCNPSQSAKNRFKLMGETTVPDIQIDQFSCNIEKLVNKLKKEGYDDVIFDMPPNSDPYSDTILRMYLSHSSKYPASLYVVSSFDVAHIESTMEWYDKYITANNSQRTVTVNLMLPKTIKKISKENAKTEWFKNTKYKYYIVLNNNFGIQMIKNKESIFNSLTNQSYPFRNLVYLFVDYDAAYSKSKEQMISSANYKDIRVENTIDIESFYIYDEIINP